MAPLIIGSVDDPHVQAVLSAVKRRPPAVVDATTVGEMSLAWSVDALYVDGESAVGHGWIRRLHPAGWAVGTLVESKAAAEFTTRLAALAGVVRTAPIEWLTPLDSGVAAENKLVQLAAAARLGIPAPESFVASDLPDTPDLSDWVVKPLGPAHFVDEDGRYNAVHVHRMADVPVADIPDLFGTPVLMQRYVEARRHLRVVTVGHRAWSAALDAHGLPVDWRAASAAHEAFEGVALPDVERSAVALASALGVGFSSQDWVDTGTGMVFLDLNPAGQWLFLPTPVAEGVTSGIAKWLDGGAL